MSKLPARTLYLVKRAETACRTGLEACLPELGLTPSQYTGLSLLAANPEQSSAELARRVGVSPQSMSEIISALERKQLVVRAEDPEWRRVLKIQLTDTGREILDRSTHVVDALEAQLLAGLDEQAVATLRAALDRIVRNSGNA